MTILHTLSSPSAKRAISHAGRLLWDILQQEAADDVLSWVYEEVLGEFDPAEGGEQEEIQRGIDEDMVTQRVMLILISYLADPNQILPQ